MNADKRRLKRIGLSVFIGVNRRLKMPFSDFFSSLQEQPVSRAQPRSEPRLRLPAGLASESRVSRTFCASPTGVKGFCRNAVPLWTPSLRTTSWVCPDMNMTRSEEHTSELQ